MHMRLCRIAVLQQTSQPKIIYTHSTTCIHYILTQYKIVPLPHPIDRKEPIMATMKEIAELAGVSRGTVDRVLNNRGTVNPETEKKVREIATLLDYKPNKAGMALAIQKKKIKIGVLLFEPSDEFFNQILSGIRKKLKDLSVYGITLIEKRCPFDSEGQKEKIAELLEEGIHGLILTPYNSEEIQHRINELWDLGIPTVTVNSDLANSNRLAYVGTDDQKDGRTAAGLLHLFMQQKGSIAIVTGSLKILSHKDRVEAFTSYMKELEPAIQILDVIETYDDDYRSFDQVRTLIQAHPDVSAFLFTSGGVYGGCRAIQESDFPKKPHVVTFDDVSTTKEMLLNGVISATICQQPQEQGAVSLTILTNYLLFGNTPSRPCTYMDLQIKIRESI